MEDIREATTRIRQLTGELRGIALPKTTREMIADRCFGIECAALEIDRRTTVAMKGLIDSWDAMHLRVQKLEIGLAKVEGIRSANQLFIEKFNASMKTAAKKRARR